MFMRSTAFFALLMLCCAKDVPAQSPGFDTLLVHINFENGADSILIFSEDSSSTRWQTGRPQKTVFDSSYSPDRAIVTDTLVPYTPNAFTWFEVPFVPNAYGVIEQYNYVCPLQVCFKHKIDIDSLHAGGMVEARQGSVLKPLTSDLWGNSFYYLSGIPYNLYDPWVNFLYNGSPGFNYNTGWTYSCVTYIFDPIGPPTEERAFDTLYFRFTFLSDSVVNAGRDGWMVDDIMIGRSDIFFCGFGNVDNQGTGNWSIYPNPANERLMISFGEVQDEILIRVTDVSGKIVLSEVIEGAASAELNTGSLRSGIYFVHISGPATLSKKIAIVH